jgi:hypothetical protein
MNPNTISEQLNEVRTNPDFIELTGRLTEEWSVGKNAIDAVDPILRFMEANPALDYGMPGPLVHFVEHFYGSGYERKLVESIERHPTSHTVWMLNRVINGTKDKRERDRLTTVLERAGQHALADTSTRESVARFLERLSKI